MAKIGILTFHRSYNYGAFMQCYSLSHRLAKDFPEHTVEVIDYATERCYKNYTTDVKSFIFSRKTLKGILINCCKLLADPKLLKRRKILYSAFENELSALPGSKETVISDDYVTFLNKIRDEYDVIIVGSDGVWEFKSYPFPNAYFLGEDLGNTVLMSFAASSDRMHFSDVDEDQKNYISDALSRYEYLGVRDVATENFVNYINPQLSTYHNCDPTVFLDLQELPKGLDRVKKILKKKKIDILKPIICVMGDTGLCKMVREMFGKKYQIVSVYHYSKYADCYLNDLTPIEWAQVFSLFSVTVTRFFHGSLLSLKNGCPTVATDFWYRTDEKHKTKIEDLYERLNLTDHYFFMGDVKTKEDFDRIKERIEQYIENPDKEAIRLALAKEAENYNSFREALHSVLKALD